MAETYTVKPFTPADWDTVREQGREEGRREVLREIAAMQFFSSYNANHDAQQCLFCYGLPDDVTNGRGSGDADKIIHRESCLWLQAQAVKDAE